MRAREEVGDRGILNPRGGDGRFTLVRHAPMADLAAFVERHWIVRWDLRGRAPHTQETLPYPCVNVVIGMHQPGVFGVFTTRFVASLDGEGWVVGTKFCPGGFRPFWNAPISTLTDRVLSLSEAFGDHGAALERAVLAAADDDARIRLVGDFFVARAPGQDPDAARARSVVEQAAAEHAVVRVAALAERARMSPRTLQRLFDEYVGVPPKWVIRRFRVHEAAEQAKDGARIDWAALAAQLGYADQAHFTHEFKAQIGQTPGEYAATCARASASRGEP